VVGATGVLGLAVIEDVITYVLVTVGWPTNATVAVKESDCRA